MEEIITPKWNALSDMAKCDGCGNKTICKNVEQITKIKQELKITLETNNLEVLEIGLKCTFFGTPIVNEEMNNYI